MKLSTQAGYWYAAIAGFFFGFLYLLDFWFFYPLLLSALNGSLLLTLLLFLFFKKRIQNIMHSDWKFGESSFFDKSLYFCFLFILFLVSSTLVFVLFD